MVLINALREEGDDSEKRSSVRAKVLEQGAGEREFDRDSKAPVMPSLQYTRPASLPFFDQSARVPLVLMCDRCK